MEKLLETIALIEARLLETEGLLEGTDLTVADSVADRIKRITTQLFAQKATCLEMKTQLAEKIHAMALAIWPDASYRKSGIVLTGNGSKYPVDVRISTFDSKAHFRVNQCRRTAQKFAESRFYFPYIQGIIPLMNESLRALAEEVDVKIFHKEMCETLHLLQNLELTQQPL